MTQTLVLTILFLMMGYSLLGIYNCGRIIKRLEAMVRALNDVENAYEAGEITATQAIYLVRTYLHDVDPREFTLAEEEQMYSELGDMVKKKVKRKVRV